MGVCTEACLGGRSRGGVIRVNPTEVVNVTSSEFSKTYELTRLVQSYKDAGYHELFEARNRNTG